MSLNFRVWKYLKSGFGILSSKVTDIQKEILPVKLWWICLVQVQKSYDNSFLHWPRKAISVLRSGIPGAVNMGLILLHLLCRRANATNGDASIWRRRRHVLAWTSCASAGSPISWRLWGEHAWPRSRTLSF
jgi:hypothetical protein